MQFNELTQLNASHCCTDALPTHGEETESKPARGRLKIFFGAVAGVGKTYAMLQAANAQRDAGIDVIAGIVETHGRAETEAQLRTLEILPRRVVEHSGTSLTEFDLDAALTRQPQLILVDELAHTNIPGSRHPKRWQDIKELIESGINVYTTVNVQHLESLNDIVEKVTGVRVHETVPDAIVENADELELADLSPDELLLRLKEGKVHASSQNEYTQQSFFRKGNLIALRELSLRLTAAHVDADMRDYRRDNAIREVWPIAERILVCVGVGVDADNLIRAGKRIADTLRAEWIVVSVETPDMLRLPAADRDRRIRLLQLAEELGAESITLGGASVASAVLAYARTRNVSRIVVGKPRQRSWLKLLRANPIDTIVAESGDVDVHVISGAMASSKLQNGPMLARTRAHFELPERSDKNIAKKRKGYAWSLAVTAICTALAWLGHPYLALPNLVMFYLLGVIVVAARFGRGPAMLASLTAVLTFDFLFVTTDRTIALSDTEYFITFSAMLITALIISELTTSVRLQAKVAGHRERRTALLYAMSRELAVTRHTIDMLKIAVKHVSEVFESQVVILLPDAERRLALPTGEGISGSYHGADLRIAEWVYAHRVPAGLGTTTHAGSEALYLPLLGSSGPVGALAVLPVNPRRILLPEQRHLLETFAGQIALAIERVHLAGEAQSAQLKIETEHLRNSLLSAISHDLRTPLAIIAGSASSLVEGYERLAPPATKELSQAIFDEAQRMNTLVNNLLDMTRLESGTLQLNRQWYPLEEVIGTVLNRLSTQLDGRNVNVSLPTDLPLLQIDGVLIEQVLVNLLENVLKYTAKNTPIEVAAETKEKTVQISVADEGPGLPIGAKDRVFDKFYRGRSESAKSGVGLGLAICKAIIEVHGGRIWAEDRQPHGAIFRFTLPRIGTPPKVEPEAEVKE